MQPSMANSNSPSSRIVKDKSVQISGMVNLHLIIVWTWWIFTKQNSKKGESWTNVRFIFLLFSLFESESLPKINKSAWWIFTLIYLRGGESWPNCFWKEVNWCWILTQRFCWKGEQRWRLEVGRFKMPFDACIMWYTAKCWIHFLRCWLMGAMETNWMWIYLTFFM